MERNGRERDQLKVIHGLLFQGENAQTLPEATWSEGKAIVLVSLACDTSNNGRLCTYISMSETTWTRWRGSWGK